MKDTKYKILAYFDNQSYLKLFNEVNSDYAENLQILLHNLSLFSYDVLIIGVILYKENISNIISAIRKITQIPIIILTDASSLLCMSWKKELIYAGADCVMDINSTVHILYPDGKCASAFAGSDHVPDGAGMEKLPGRDCTV